MAQYTEEHKLPSLGKINDINPIITLRNMTTAEEKLLLGSTSNALDQVLNSCIVEPAKLDVNSLISPDKHFILIKLRVLSYGPDYYVKHKCPSCGKLSEYKIDLDKLDVHYLDEDFTEPFDEFTLPVSNKKVALRLPRMSDLNDADAKARKFHKKFPDAKGDMAYVYRLIANIYSVDDDAEMTSIQLQNFVEELHTRDTAYIKNRMSKVKIGIDTTIFEECPNSACGEDVQFELPINSEFFHARFDD
ncbi:baseplate hub subunit [Bacillus phage SP-15]|uniref:Baseplate hub subunit n=1 Tax=Bacillus phage SP-15 TaxID=1792032 RepID=A0A127AX46_9CAUD|nr:baseplate hub [Bacillus phage SP-15]AMM44844.1 baseplate hub subunit [Bacillus phage SP-15]